MTQIHHIDGGQPDSQHRIPEGVDRSTVDALGKLSEGLEAVEQARGFLYGFHRLSGTADLAMGEAVEMFREAGHGELADRIEQDVIGRNVIAGRWTFQIVEEYDDGYWSAVREAERTAREQLVGGRRHLFEASMKEDRRTHGTLGHEATPGDVAAN